MAFDITSWGKMSPVGESVGFIIENFRVLRDESPRSIATVEETIGGVVDTKGVSPLGLSRVLGYIHDQGSPSTVWVIPHGLNRHPSVVVVDSAGTEVRGAVKHVDRNNMVINFNAGFSGKAYLN